MYEEVENKLIENEKIELTLETDVRKTKKYWEKYVYSLILVIILWALFIYTYCVNHDIGGAKYYASGFSFDKYIAFLGVIIITIFLAFFFAYDLMVNTKNRFNKYWFTNLRVIAFNNKKGYTIRYLERIDRVGVYNNKNNYADIILIFKKVTASDRVELPLDLTGIKNYEEVIKFIKEKNEDVEIFDDTNLIKKKNKNKQKESTPEKGNIVSGTTVDTSGIMQMDANKPNRHLGSSVGNVNPNRIPMSDEEAQAEKAALFKRPR